MKTEMRSRAPSLARIAVATGMAAATLWCASCSLTTSLDGLSGGVERDGAVAPSAEAGTPDGDAGASSDAAGPDGDKGDAPSPSSAYRAAVLADLPIAYWRLDESAAGAPAKDASGQGHDGVYGSGVTLGVPGALAGDSDKAAHFDGLNSNVSIGDIFRFADVTSYTLEAWVHPMANTNFGSILARDSDPDGYSIFLTPALALGAERQKPGTDDILSGPVLDTSSFDYVVVTYDGSLLRLFLNGTLVQGPSASGAIPGAAAGFFIGADFSGAGDLFSGDIDEPAVYDHALSDTQILAHYKIGKGL
jgi:hypothetical protein